MSGTFARSNNVWSVRRDYEWIYPPGCGLPINVTYNSKLASIDDSVRYIRDQRPYPTTPLTENLTSRDQVFHWKATAGVSYQSSFGPCPHGGIHGNQELRVYADYPLASAVIGDTSGTNWASLARQSFLDMKLNLGDHVAEYRETAKLFKSAGVAIYKGYKAIKSLKITGKSVRYCSIPAAVLGYQYGIKPLVSDLFTATEILRLKLSLPLAGRKSVMGVRHSDGTVHQSNSEIQYLTKLSQRATLYFELETNSSIVDYGTPPQWLWEATPFSFVVDSVIGIGEWLAQLDALRGVSNLRGTLTTKIRCSQLGVHTFSPDGSAPFTKVSEAKSVYKSYKRDVITSIPPPALPSYQPSKSWYTIMNQLMVLWTLNPGCDRANEHLNWTHSPDAETRLRSILKGYRGYRK